MRAAASSLTIGSDPAALANCLRRDPGREDSGTTPATARSSVRAIKQNNNARRDSADPAQSPSQIVPPLVRGTRKFGTNTAPTRFDGSKNSARFRRPGAAQKFRRKFFFPFAFLSLIQIASRLLLSIGKFLFGLSRKIYDVVFLRFAVRQSFVRRSQFY